ncbi:cyclic pyranopterin monophosphate synthase MoaC [Thermogladius sp. 4427co]|uniref:cyclic pyranopterin monophosphate synthase MoaC n=1 Tax=Thermogladius sp. 4427co TaxID=3450718 RepID=UPI003F79F2B1
MSMVDITAKKAVYREAVAEGVIRLRPETIQRIRDRSVEKGDVIEVTKAAVALAVKKTSELLPLCHPIPITHVDIGFEFLGEDRIKLVVRVKTIAQTGVEMEALTGVVVGLLNIWDMVKKYEKDESGQYPETWIENIRVVSKVKSLHA